MILPYFLKRSLLQIKNFKPKTTHITASFINPFKVTMVQPCMQREDTSSQNASFENILKKFKPEKENILPILHCIHDTYSYIPEKAVECIAKYIGTTPADIYGVISFYGLFSTSLKGKYIVRVCISPPCHVMGAHNIIETIKEILKIKEGETRSDNLFTLELVSCLGLCDKAPSMMINNDIYTGLTSEKVKNILHNIIEVESCP